MMMNGFKTRAWILSLVLAAPGIATAQTPPTEETPKEVTEPAKQPEKKESEDKKSEEKKAEEAKPTEAKPAEAAPEKKPEEAPKAEEAAKAEEPKAEEAKPAEEAQPAAPEAAPAAAAGAETPAEPEKAEPSAEKKAEMEALEKMAAEAKAKAEAAKKAKAAEEAKPKEQPTAGAKTGGTAAAAAGAGAGAGKGKGKGKKGKGGDDAATQMAIQAAMGGLQGAGKPWVLVARLGTQVGIGSFVSGNDSQQNNPSLAWSLGVTGTYQLTKLLEGRLTAFGRASVDQILINSSTDIFITKKNEFFFRDLQLGLLGQQLYKEKFTGIVVGGSTSFALPTSKLAQAAGRILRWNVGVNAVRVFPKLGPGNLILSAFFTFRKDFGPEAATFDADDAASRANACASTTDAGDCITNSGNLNLALIYGGSVAYTYAGFTLGWSITLFSTQFHNLGNNSVASVEQANGIEVGSSQFAQQDNLFRNLSFGSISLSYLFTPNLNAGVSMSTFQNPFIQSGNNSSRLRFPWFDFDSSSQNLTTVNFSVGGNY